MFLEIPQVILVVENEFLVLRFVCTVLKRAGFTVLPATTPDEAIRIEQEFGDSIDLLITAFSLPRYSGSELAAEFERRHPGMPVLLMSGDPEASRVARNAAWTFLPKPFLPSTLLNKIRERAFAQD